ncbi:MAG: signal peptidase I [Acidimicrobiales bacterium]
MALDANVPPADVPKARSRRRVALEWLIAIVVVASASLVIRTYVFQTYFIPSGSMNPTLWKGNHIIVNKLSVEFGTINIGDIVVFKAPPDVRTDCGDPVADLVKRVIGVPGDHLTSKGNTIYVNGKPLDQNWSHYVPLGTTPIGNVTVPKNHYFMMGDNHAGSCDSRTWGTVPRSDIIGKVFMKIWPLSQWHWF